MPDLHAEEEMSESIEKYLPPRAHFSAKEISQVLGVSDSSVYQMIAEGALPAVRIRGQIKIQRERFISWYQKLSKDGAGA
jgi:excisionase family DNA binding protein